MPTRSPERPWGIAAAGEAILGAVAAAVLYGVVTLPFTLPLPLSFSAADCSFEVGPLSSLRFHSHHRWLDHGTKEVAL